MSDGPETDSSGSRDPLTNLARRHELIEHLEQQLQHRDGRDHCVLLLQIEDFRQINNTFGYDVGDQVLRATAERLQVCADDAFVARTGANEFVVHIPGGAGGGEHIASRILSLMSMRVTAGEQEVAVRASVGLATGVGVDTPHQLLRRASLAAEEAGQGAGGQCVIFHEELAERADARGMFVGDLTRALGRDELFLCFQPIVATPTRIPFALEALARWEHPDHGTLAGGAFIPQAEATGLVGRVDRWALERACSEASQWQDELADVPVTVNMSALSASASTLCLDVETALATSGLDPARLILEITETALLRDVDRVAQQLLSLRAMGVRVALDDFGTGYSSLSYLERLPFDWLKLDASYSRRVGEDRRAQAILSATLQIADALDMRVIVEGIETAAHARLLDALGVELFQGYYFSWPERNAALRPAVATAIARAVDVHEAGVAHRVPDHLEDELLTQLADRLQHRIEGAVDEVRRTMAAELHDDPLQQLWAADLSLESSMGADDSVDQILLAQQGVRRAMKRLRELMVGGRVEEAGQPLEQRLRELVDDYSSRWPRLRFTLEADRLDGVVEPDVTVTTYRIVGEALANVVKHAEATTVEVEVRAVGQAVEIEVTDDGIGFDPQTAPPRTGASGFGMTSMQDRAGRVGGLLTIHSRRGTGTTVRALLPLRHAVTGRL